MASFLSKLCTASLLVMLFSSPCLAVVSSSVFNSPDTICNSTPYPSFCKSMLPNNRSGTIFDYGRISFHQSISTAKGFLSLLNQYLKSSSNLSQSTIGALQDCQFLAGLNQDFLINTLAIVNNTNSTLHSSQAEDLHSLLSAVITNQDTCLDGIQATFTASSIRNSLSEPIQNGTKAYSVSLGLFTNSWGTHVGFRSRWLRERKLTAFSNTQNQKTYGFFRRRMILQTTPVIGNVSVSQMVVVNPDGTGNFTTINDAVKVAPNNTKGSSYFVIYVVAGIYEEYVSIPSNKKYVMMIGDGINQTIITGNHSVADNWTTFNSATFAVVAQGFVAVNITFRNTAGAIQQQAVALRNGADLSAFYKCSFEGYQDTLYTHSLRQFYRECNIYGTIDFIFGNAAVVFQNCNIYSRLPLSGQFNTITAQGRTDPNQNTGTSIQGCSITASSDLASSNGTTKTYLGRPWKEYSRTVYMQSFIDSLIDPSGWHEWSGNFSLSTLYYAEFNNTGPGSNTSSRVTWPGYRVINESDAVTFTVSNFIIGDYWLNTTAVPYTGGFINQS
ncbi:pectinesterase-like [Tripterygium wilfordii]|uniref:pectinesterase-like n=1 Tax=Tripterygium wilfordii TaxID=458696 RepID=UPI0018F7EE94|nr:pectinesterase-like [Tripterygium wilfordii]